VITIDAIRFWKEFQEEFDRAEIDGKFKLKKGNIQDTEWTNGIQDVIHSMFKTHHTCLGYKTKEDADDRSLSGEFLKIDFYVFRRYGEFEITKLSEDIGIIAIEHENGPSRMAKNLAKLLNTKAMLKVFIGYCNSKDERENLIEDIHKQIESIDKNLCFSDEELLIILGYLGMGVRSGDYMVKKINLDSGVMTSLASG